ncbi:macrophage mannose receptor 1-like [Thalassophryne amazonica]|uniref:macrophage mannose receptor 1-like n=1 Tax=Thalassophryne amazonica TaxID=390379 RepID=UPI001470D4CD|nr:macrophage mannose receptor 1-like [Thalassophryne amazonica]
MRIPLAVILLLIQTSICLAKDVSEFELTNPTTGFCLYKIHDYCYRMLWTTGDRLLFKWLDKCLGVQGKSVGSEVALYDCDEKSELQRWECKNETLLALKGTDFYINLKADSTAVLSKTVGPSNHLHISDVSQGPCSRTARVLYTIEGNGFGRPCMFPFMYKERWYSECTETDSATSRKWCGIETKYENELWGYCPTTLKKDWTKHPVTGAFYQLNLESLLQWAEADASCKQQGASLLSITDPHQHAYVLALLGNGNYRLWNGLILDLEHGWQWASGRPYAYLKWDSGYPLLNPGYQCGVMDGSVEYSWQNSLCNKKLGYICYGKPYVQRPTEAPQAGFCSQHWIPYSGHCFFLQRTSKTWSDAQKECRKEGGDLASIHNVEDQSFVISQLGYASNDELWIGLNDINTEGLFQWSDHSTVTFTSWMFGNPAISTQQEDCVLIKGQNGNWDDRQCKEKHGFICMKPSAAEASSDEEDLNAGCKSGWKRHGSYCYFIGSQTKTFDEAQEDCKTSDSYLADISTGIDNAFLVSLVGMRPEKYFWLGLSNQKNIDNFVWTNSALVKFTHWNAEMPGREQGCVAMATGIFAGLWNVLPCTNKEKYICKHLAEDATLTPAPPTLTPPNCFEGWTRVGKRSDCYKLFSLTDPGNGKTWYEARDFCRAIGGDLLSIHSAADQDIRGYSSAWIGLSAPDPVTAYVWSDGSPLNFQHWEEGEPNNKNNAESCAEFAIYRHNSEGSWNDVHCEKLNRWICQIRAGFSPHPTPQPVAPDYNKTSDGWLQWNGSQYYLNNQRLHMEGARDYCKKKHSDLVVINSEAESIFLWKQIIRSYGSYYIGLTVDLDGTFGWMDRSPVVFQRWQDGQPDFKLNDENCVIMTTVNGFWHDTNCGTEYRSICKRNGSPPANTTVAPTVLPKGGCSPEWEKFNSKCYRIFNDRKVTWEDARQQCQSAGGNLVSIGSRRLAVFLITKMAATPTTDMWIGMHSFHGGQFLWTDGQPKTYTNFEVARRRHLVLSDSDAIDRYMLEDYFSRRHQMDPENKCAVITTKPSIGIGKWVPRSCNDTNGFICHKNLDSSRPDSPESTPNIYVTVANDSIRLVPKNLTWGEARKLCEGENAKLSNVRNEWAQAYVELLASTLKTPLWIGLNKLEGGYFKYVDGWHLRYSNWDYGEPRRDGACVYVDKDGKWKTASCNRTMNSVCMQSTAVPPTESSEFPGQCPEDPELSYGQRNTWLPFKGYCYIFFPNGDRWSDAATNCVRHSGALTSIENPDEQQFIQTQLKRFEDSHNSFWIGLFQNQRGEWKWLDRTVMDYSNWELGEPMSGYTYGSMKTSDGSWTASRNFYRRPYVCKAHKVVRSAPPTPPVVHILDIHHPKRWAVVVIVVTVILVGVIALVLFKKYGKRIQIPSKLTTFDNPLFFNNERSQPDVVDTSKLVENAAEENPEPVITL